MIPPPLAEVSSGLAVAPSSMFLSSTVSVVEFTVVVEPLTIRLPVIVRSPPTDAAPSITAEARVATPSTSRAAFRLTAPSTSKVL